MEIILKIILYLIAGVFMVVGIAKAIGIEALKKEYKRWNISSPIRVLIGVLEIITAGLLLFTSTQLIGMWAVTIIMIGAFAVLIIVSEYKRVILSLLFWVLAIYFLNETYSIEYTSPMILAEVIFMIITVVFFAYKPTPMNTEGEKETLPTGVEVTHRFKETLNGVKYHFVEASETNKDVVVMIPGAPETWFAFYYVLSVLSEDFRVLSLDLKGYGQTDADLDGDHRFEHISQEIIALLDNLGIDKFYLVAHDRGAMAADHIVATKSMNERIVKYVRMQQSCNEPHGYPRPPFGLMRSFLGTMFFKFRWAMTIVYTYSIFVSHKIPKEIVRRLEKEFKFKDINLKMPLSYKTTTFEKELKDRHDFIFEKMTMPTLILQGKFDPGQHPEEYENATKFIKNGQVQFIEANHFLHLERPKETSEAILAFLKN